MYPVRAPRANHASIQVACASAPYLFGVESAKMVKRLVWVPGIDTGLNTHHWENDLH